MSSDVNPRHAELVAWLTDRGHSPDEIARILDKVAEYDERTINESLFDSIAGLTEYEVGRFIHSALHDGPEKLDER